MNMKLLAASLSSLLATTAGAFNSIGQAKRIIHPRISSTVLGGSYLDGLSNPPAPAQVGAATTAGFATPSAPSPSSAARMTLELADALADAVVATAKRNHFPPIVVTVLDKQANAIVQKRMDGDVHVAFPDFSYAKAYTSVAFDTSSREFRDKYTTGNDPAKVAQLNSMVAIAGGGGKMAAFPGGVPLRNDVGECVGAIGVSGAAGDEDEYCALRAAWDVGMGTSPSAHSCGTALDG